MDVRRLIDADWEAENSVGLEAESQAWGRAAGIAGFEAMRVPSAAKVGAVNVVVFVDQLLPRSRIESHGLEG
jgi:hypothetical protein